jgi:hypothetical protein
LLFRNSLRHLTGFFHGVNHETPIPLASSRHDNRVQRAKAGRAVAYTPDHSIAYSLRCACNPVSARHLDRCADPRARSIDG